MFELSKPPLPTTLFDSAQSDLWDFVNSVINFVFYCTISSQLSEVALEIQAGLRQYLHRVTVFGRRASTIRAVSFTSVVKIQRCPI